MGRGTVGAAWVGVGSPFPHATTTSTATAVKRVTHIGPRILILVIFSFPGIIIRAVPYYFGEQPVMDPLRTSPEPRKSVFTVLTDVNVAN